MVNILSPGARSHAKIEYRLRTFTVLSFALAAVFGASTILLIPAYVYIQSGMRQAEAKGSASQRALSQKELSETVAKQYAASALLASVKQQLASPRPSQAVSAVFAVQSSSIALTRIEYTQGTNAGTVRLSGTAETRDALLAFKQALGSVPGVSDVVLPLSSLAAAAKVSFSMSLTYKPLMLASTTATSSALLKTPSI